MLCNDRYKLFTIGVYGFTEARFFNALKFSGVELLCDIRRRRGVRSSKYRFANSNYLQQRLKELKIGYHHAINLVPDGETRSKQWQEDKDLGVSKREREMLGVAFTEAYRQRCLQNFNAESFLARIANDFSVICFLCVEKSPTACHRSLVTQAITKQMSVSCEDLLP